MSAPDKKISQVFSHKGSSIKDVCIEGRKDSKESLKCCLGVMPNTDIHICCIKVISKQPLLQHFNDERVISDLETNAARR